MSIGHLYIFLGRVCSDLVQIFIGQLDLFLSCRSSLCILDNSPLSNICLVNIFAQCVAYLYFFFNDILQRAKVFNVDEF